MDKETKEYLQNKIVQDIENMADDVSIIFDEAEETGLPSITIIADLIMFAKKNGVDFWKTVKKNCSKYEHNRLKYIFNNNTDEGFDKDDKIKPVNRPEYRSKHNGRDLVLLSEAKLLPKDTECDCVFLVGGNGISVLLKKEQLTDKMRNYEGAQVYPAPYKT
jgi:hypothetical protein